MANNTGYSPNNPRAYLGPNLYVPVVVTRPRAPTTADYRQPENGKLYPFNSFWLVGKDPTTGVYGDMWYLANIVSNAANWIKVSSGTSGPMLGITVPSGTSPVVMNASGQIAFTSSGGTLTITGGLNTINFDLVGGSVAVDSFTVPHGTSPVVPNASGSIAITEGSGITITGGLNTYSIAASATTPLAFPCDTGTATPAANALTLAGSGSIATTGSGAIATFALTGLTNHAVLVGAGTSTITKLAVGVNNSILMGNTGADPAFTTTGTPYVTGISFDAGSNTLSNYVTSTWTPTIYGGTTAGTTTYVSQVGIYTRIGNVVHIQGYIEISAATGTGDLQIGGLPFTIQNTASSNPRGSVNFNGSGWTWPVGRTSLTAQGITNDTYCLVVGCGTGVSSANMQMTNAALTVSFSLTYLV